MTSKAASMILAVLTMAPASAQTANDFFNASVLHDLDIRIHPTDWQRLKDHFTENTYYLCDLRWRNLVVENIGIRSRGFGSRSARKPGLRVDFDRFQPTQEFLSLKSVVLDNSMQDRTMLKERLAMLLYKRMGVPAPREAHARLFINGKYFGLYTIVESVDKRFLKQTYGEDDGYLYEYKWGGDYRLEDRGTDISRYAPLPFKPVTHEKDPNHAPLVEMLRTIVEPPQGRFREAISPYLDVKAFLTYVAVENFLADFDGFLGEWGMNNFYLYRFDKKKLNQFIAWDKDNSFSDPKYPIWQNAYTNALMSKCMTDNELRDHYLRELLRAAAIAGDRGGWLEQELMAAASQVRAAAHADATKDYPNEIYDESVDALFDFVRERGAFVRREVESAGFTGADRPSLSSVVLAPVEGQNAAKLVVHGSGVGPAEVEVIVSGFVARILSVSPGVVEVELPIRVLPESATITLLVNGVPSNTVGLNLAY
jgi:hypothetical protein